MACGRDPFYYQRSQQRVAQGEQMGFLESVFSFVFGDGDPNVGYEEQKWKLIGRMIQSRWVQKAGWQDETVQVGPADCMGLGVGGRGWGRGGGVSGVGGRGAGAGGGSCVAMCIHAIAM